jgi:hypothetical protein
MDSHVDNIVEDNPVSNDHTLKRVDYKYTTISDKIDSQFYNSPYFYVPVIISLIGIGFYYYYNPINPIWLDYINLNEIDIDNLFSESLPGSPDEYSDYFKSPSPIVTPIDSPVGSPLGSPTWSSEGSPTPTQIRLHLPN